MGTGPCNFLCILHPDVSCYLAYARLIRLPTIFRVQYPVKTSPTMQTGCVPLQLCQTFCVFVSSIQKLYSIWLTNTSRYCIQSANQVKSSPTIQSVFFQSIFRLAVYPPSRSQLLYSIWQTNTSPYCIQSANPVKTSPTIQSVLLQSFGSL